MTCYKNGVKLRYLKNDFSLILMQQFESELTFVWVVVYFHSHSWAHF